MVENLILILNKRITTVIYMGCVRIKLYQAVAKAPRGNDNREVHVHSCIMGNQGKMARNSKICIGIQSQLILPEFIYLMLFEKSNLRVQRKKYTESGVQRCP